MELKKKKSETSFTSNKPKCRFNYKNKIKPDLPVTSDNKSEVTNCNSKLPLKNANVVILILSVFLCILIGYLTVIFISDFLTMKIMGI